MTLKLIQQGAEAKILLDEKNSLIIKDRISKSYRHPNLDAQIRKRRTKSEAKLLTKASKIISAPKLIKTDEKEKIEMQFINGKKLSEHLDNFALEKQKEICNEIGSSVAKLHKENIIHGDLTTSNMILQKDIIYFIDFGLGYISRKIEDKAVDLHLIKHALEAKHFKNYEILTKEILNSYEKIAGKTESEKIFERIKSIEKRRRYRH
ncbi:MAG: KEOPS complex kinase/ATPase Bud32 [Nanoarchaeota archaeon]|nr:KEOPS complex kinase/ATPase Bud32 [Nanoarchaeota archaeon]